MKAGDKCLAHRGTHVGLCQYSSRYYSSRYSKCAEGAQQGYWESAESA